MHSLPLFLRVAGEPVLLVGEGESAEAKRRLIERAGGRPVAEDDADAARARIAFIACETDEEAHAAAARLKARGLIVNAADRPDLCDFTTPAIAERGPVLIAVSTGGASAGLAKELRQRIEALLPESLGKLAEALEGARAAMRRRWPGARARREAIDAALSEGGALDPFAEQAEGAVERWLDAPDGAATGGVHDIVLRSADPDDLTLREARLLARADAVHAAPGVPDAVLARARADAARRDYNAPMDDDGDGDNGGGALIVRIRPAQKG